MTDNTPAKPDLPPLGIHANIPNETYHRGPGISKSGLDLIAKSPLDYITQKRHPKPPTRPMLVGNAAHTLILEPSEFPNRYIKSEYREFRSNEAKAWRTEQEAAGRFVLSIANNDDEYWSPSEWDYVHRMRDAVMLHPYAGILLNPEQGIAEQSGYWIDPEVDKLAKLRTDWRNLAHGNLIVDLKTIQACDKTTVQRAVAERRYHLQAAWYLRGMRLLGEPASGFVFIFVEKTPPFKITLWDIRDEPPFYPLSVGEELALRDLRVYSECMDRNEWPGLPDQIRTLELTEWQLKGKVK